MAGVDRRGRERTAAGLLSATGISIVRRLTVAALKPCAKAQCGDIRHSTLLTVAPNVSVSRARQT